MDLWRKVYFFLTDLFYACYPVIMLLSVALVVLTAYLQYELTVNNNDLIYWKRLTELCARHFTYYHLLLLLGAVALNALIMVIICVYYLRPVRETPTEMSLLELKDRYTKFIVLRLIARLDKIQAKFDMKRGNCPGAGVAVAVAGNSTRPVVQQVRNHMRAHENMAKAVAIFRKDVRKVLAPSESEITLPIEDVFSIAEDEEKALRHAGYYKLPVEYTDEIMRTMLDPKN